MENISLPAALPADLPTNWQENDIVAPNGADAGLSQQHGYNYLMEQVNAAQEAINLLGNAMVNNTYLLKGGTEIPESADLNTYTTPGNYYCDASVKAQTLINCPVSHAFTLKVEFGTGSRYPTQVLRNYMTGQLFWRYQNSHDSSMQWSDWKQYAFVDDITLSRLGVTATVDELNVLHGNPNTVTNNLAALSLAPTQRIPNGDDLNDYLTPGSYLVRDSVNAAAIVNTPITTSGYDLHVLQTYGLGSDQTYRTQIAVTFAGRIFSRYRGRDGVFSPWKEWKLDGTTLNDLGITATAEELNYVDGVTSPIQGQLDQLEDSAQRPTWLLKGGIEIPESADLNTYTTPGNYYCDASVKAQTLINCPVSRAFTLKVEFGTGRSYPTQVLRNYMNGQLFWRYQNSDDSSMQWSAWKQYAFVEDITLAKLGITATAAELNKLDGVTATTQELNYVDGVTSPIQGQLDEKVTKKYTIPDIENTRAWTYVNAYHADGTLYGAIGVLGKAGRCSYFYIGFGDSPWDSAASLIVGDGQFTYQGNDIYHKGNPPSLADLGLDQVAVKMVGSYVGDGTFGADHKIVLNFDRMPHVVFLTQRTNPNQESKNAMSHTLIRGMGYFWVRDNSNTGCHINWYKTSIEIWSTDNAQYQFNTDGETYDYVAI